ncbi:MAG: hemolysin III channel protein, partial [Marinobacter sp. T13-3]
IPYMHAIWHLFVIGGSACHFAAIYSGVLPHTV